MSGKINRVDKTSMALDDIIKLDRKTKKSNGYPKLNRNRNIAQKAKNNAIRNLNTRKPANLNNSISNKRNTMKANLNQRKISKISPTKILPPRNSNLNKRPNYTGNRNIRQSFTNNSGRYQNNRPLQGLKITKSNENFNNQRRPPARNNQTRGRNQRNFTRTISNGNNNYNRNDNYNRYNDNYNRNGNNVRYSNYVSRGINRNYNTMNTRRSYEQPQDMQYSRMARALIDAHNRSRNMNTFNRSSNRYEPTNAFYRRYVMNAVQKLLHDSLIKTGHVGNACIIDKNENKVLVGSNGFTMTNDQIDSIVSAFSSPYKLLENDFEFGNNGRKFECVRADNDAIYLKDDRSGLILGQTDNLIILASYNESMMPAICVEAVEKLTDYLSVKECF